MAWSLRFPRLETEANVRSHGTLKERPLDRFERERPLATGP